MEEDEVVVVLCIIIMIAIQRIRRRQRRWVRPWIRRRQQHEAHHALMVELTTEDPSGSSFLGIFIQFHFSLV